jgi:hypothetical protein
MTTATKDNIQTSIESQSESVKDKNEIAYGLFVYVDKQGEQGIEIVNKDSCSLNDLLGIVELAHRKLYLFWDSQHNPSLQTITKDIAMLKEISVGNNKSLKAIADILNGLHVCFKDLNNNLLESDKETIDAATPKDQVQA